MKNLRFYAVKSIENGNHKLTIVKAESEADARAFGCFEQHEITSIEDKGPVDHE